MAEQVSSVKPAILKWARISSGLSVEDVASRLKRDVKEVERWESGRSAPTYVQLEKLAYEIYKRPLAVFFLPEPPQESTPAKEFRTLPDFELQHLQPDTLYQIRLAHSFQLSLKEISDEADRKGEVIFREIRLSDTEDIQKQALKVRNFLGIPLDSQVQWESAGKALKEWRTAIEAAGIYVFKHSFKQREVSGFCLLDENFPLIYLNNSTTKTRQIFSLFHELAHILVRINGISLFNPWSYLPRLPAREKHIEVFCNALAGELLVPSSSFDRKVANLAEITEEKINALAEYYLVSREVILRKCLDKKLVSKKTYEEYSDRWSKELKSKESKESGGNYYLTQRAYLGEKYLRLVFSKHYQGKLSVEQVAHHLGVKVGALPRLEHLALGIDGPS